MTIVNDSSRVVNKLEASLNDDARVVIYDCHIFIVQATVGQSSNLYLNVVHFLTTVFIRHRWQLKAVVFQHWCLIQTILLCK